MSAFGGNTLNFGLRIGATDDTRTGLRSALASVQGFTRTALKPITIPINIARSGLGLLRDINLGLAPLVRGLDTIIERGAAVEVQQKAFQSLTGETGRNADRLANSIVKAASGTVTLARGMQIANRALASGMSLDQLRTAVEFISKFSVAIGKDAGESLNTVITGLARGSTLFLDDFGILVDGVEKVKADFDAIKGAGAFEQLAPAAQKAEIVRQAIAEMAAKTKSIGVSGKEMAFVWQGIKNQISDGVDGIVATISRTGALREALTGVRDVLAGVNNHFRAGGSIREVFFGKGDAGGGLFGIAKGALIDAGSAIGRGILGSLAAGIGNMPWLADELKSAWKWAMGELRETLKAAWEDFKSGLGINDPLSPMKFFGGRTPKHSDIYNPDGSIKITRKQAEYGAQSAAHEAAMMSYPSPARNRVPEPDFFEKARAFGRSMFGGGVLGGDSAAMKEIDKFRGMFPGLFYEPDSTSTVRPQAVPAGYRLSLGKRGQLEKEIRHFRGRLAGLNQGGREGRDSVQEANRQIAELKRQGFDPTAEERRRILHEVMERRRGELERDIWDRTSQVMDDSARRAPPAAASGRSASSHPGHGGVDASSAMLTAAGSMDGLTRQLSMTSATLMRFMQQLTGIEVTLANAKGRAN